VWVTTSALVALLLVGIVVYAATHQASGIVTALTKADRSVPGEPRQGFRQPRVCQSTASSTSAGP